jgi:DNA-binding NtrC family response regulator
MTNSTELVNRQVDDEIDRIELVVLAGPDAGQSFRATGPRCVIGTHDSADLILKDATVSRFHCELSLDGGVVIVRDLGAKNRTLVDGVPVLVAPLSDGNVLTLGKSQVRFARDVGALRVPLSPREQFGGMVGRGVAMRSVFAVLERAAAADATVLLGGETGTGKDAAALAIHSESSRRNGPFVVVDLAVAPAGLLGSELFGHEKGAFTGANQAREGAFERAHGGTVFLDEIGDLDLELQPQLLRVIESRTVQRIGGSERKPIDVRVIAATHRDLRADVNAKRFRSDLYYRLAVLEVRLPALRERAEDIPRLVEALVAELDPENEAPFARDPAWVAGLVRHPWPGNIRELRNYLERAIGLGRNHREDTIDVAVPLKEARARWVQLFENKYLEELLRAHDGNVTAAAKAAGVDRVHFYRLLARAGLR